MPGLSQKMKSNRACILATSFSMKLKNNRLWRLAGLSTLGIVLLIVVLVILFGGGFGFGWGGPGYYGGGGLVILIIIVLLVMGKL